MGAYSWGYVIYKVVCQVRYLRRHFMRRLRYLLGQGQYGTRSLRYLGGEGEAHAVVVDIEAVAGVGERNSRDEVRV